MHSALRSVLLAALFTLSAGIWSVSGRAQASPIAPVQTVVIENSGAGAVFEGLGAVSAGASSRLLIDYPEPQRSQILDYLFRPGYGAALQHLKIEIGSDANSTDGSEPSSMRSPSEHNYTRGYEWWLMAEARKRNPNIILDTLAWGAPGWVGSGRFYSADMASYVADFLEGARKTYGLDIAYTGVWNERAFNGNYVKDLHATLVQHGLHTKIVCCDEYPGEGGNQWAILDAMQKDPALAAAVDVVSVHYPWTYNNSTTPESAFALNKPLWSSEDQPNDGGGPIVSRDWDMGGRLLAKLYNRNYLEGGFTKTEIWSPITSYYDILAAPNSGLMYANTPWSGHYDVQGAIWATAHTTQFAQPGWRYDTPACGYLARGGSFVTFLSPDGKDWSSVIESIDARVPQVLRLQPQGALAHAVVHVWETNNKVTFRHIADLPMHDGAVTLTLDAGSLYSVTTTTGQGKGDAAPPPAESFPDPYRDTFEDGTEGNAPRYLADQDGAFEIHPCRGRAGSCLEQVVTLPPIPWFPKPDPFTLAGDAKLADYAVQADAQLPDTGVATLFGRIDSANVFAEPGALYPSGYGLLLKSGGDWQLLATEYKQTNRVLASGTVPPTSGQWHHLALSFSGSDITATIDGKEVTSISDSTHTRGMFALGSNWTRVQFDNLSIGSSIMPAAKSR